MMGIPVHLVEEVEEDEDETISVLGGDPLLYGW